MSVDALSAYTYANGSGSVMSDLAEQLAAQNETSDTSAQATAATTTGAARRSGLSAYGSGSVRDQVADILSLVPRKGGKLTFDDLFAYRDKLEKELTETVSADLETLGVDISKDLVLGLDKSGKVVAQAGHPDKELVDRYFAANPDLADRYAAALKVNGLANMAEGAANPALFSANLTQLSMQAWFGGQGANSLLSGSLATSLGDWDGFYGGISTTV